MNTSTALNISQQSWELDEARCPCDLHLMEWIDSKRIKNSVIFHFGTGAHHHVGIENARSERHNSVLGITASPREYQAYLDLVTQAPDVLRFYIALFGDIYLLNPKLLPIFDVVTLFHLCEFRSEKNDAYGGLTDLQLTKLLTEKTRPGGYIIFYRGSFVFDKEYGTKHMIALWQKESNVKYVGRYKSLLVYRKQTLIHLSLQGTLSRLVHLVSAASSIHGTRRI